MDLTVSDWSHIRLITQDSISAGKVLENLIITDGLQMQ